MSLWHVRAGVATCQPRVDQTVILLRQGSGWGQWGSCRASPPPLPSSDCRRARLPCSRHKWCCRNPPVEELSEVPAPPRKMEISNHFDILKVFSLNRKNKIINYLSMSGVFQTSWSDYRKRKITWSIQFSFNTNLNFFPLNNNKSMLKSLTNWLREGTYHLDSKGSRLNLFFHLYN